MILHLLNFQILLFCGLLFLSIHERFFKRKKSSPPVLFVNVLTIILLINWSRSILIVPFGRH
ncbi:hypothetical protein LINPERHAP1_LOCUS1188, partial [Linum perenne]